MKSFLVAAALLAALAGLFFLSLAVGATDTIGPSQIISDIENQAGVIWLFRLPRALTAIFAGSLLATSGLLLQSLTRNPLISPDLIGVTSGGGVAAVITLLVLGSASISYLPFTVFIGSVTVAAIVWKLGQGVSQQRFVLTGVALAALAQSFITLILVTYAPSAAEAMIWLKGSLYARTWQHAEALFPWWLLVSLACFLIAYQANPLLLGSEVAQTLGLNLPLIRGALWGLSVAAAAGAVAAVGTIGFVGLVVPHMARLMVGADLRRTLPLAMVLGAGLLLFSDTVGRILSPPLEVPAGLVCAVIGAPYFGFLLWRGKVTL